MKRLILTAVVMFMCAVVATAQPPTTKPVPQRKGWDNTENPLYGNVAKVTLRKKDHSQGVGIVYHHVVYNFNAAGDMVEEIYYQDEYGALKDCKTRWEYYPSGMTKHFVRTDMSGKVLEDITMDQTEVPAERFPAAQVAGKTITEDLYDDFGDKQGKEIRRFDAKGKILFYQQVSDYEGVIYEEHWSYDEKGRVKTYELAVDAYDIEGGYRKELHSYDAKGRKSEVKYMWVKDGPVAMRAVYKYDVQGNLTKVTRYSDQTTIQSTDEYQIQYRQ